MYCFAYLKKNVFVLVSLWFGFEIWQRGSTLYQECAVCCPKWKYAQIWPTYINCCKTAVLNRPQYSIDLEMRVNSEMVKFADDKINQRGETEEGSHRFEWVGITWQLKFSAEKHKVMHLGKSNPEYTHTLMSFYIDSYHTRKSSWIHHGQITKNISATNSK